MSSKRATATTHAPLADSSEHVDDAATPSVGGRSPAALIASPVLMNALNYAVAFAPVLIVMYVFSILRSELSRVQARLDALSVRLKSSPPAAANPYEDFQRFMLASSSFEQPQPPQQQQPPPPPPPQQLPPQQPPQPPPQLAHAPPPPAPLDAARAQASPPPPMEHRAVPVPWPPPPTQPAAVQLIPQMQPEGAKKSLPRLEELN